MRIFTPIIAGLIIGTASMAQRPAQNPISQIQYTPESLGYKLFWEDRFDGNKLDGTKWSVRGIGPRALGYVSAQAVKVEDGYLKLYAIKKGDSILISAIGTQGHFMTKYGYFECRAQLQKSTGVWAAFWIQSTDISKGEDPSIYGAEIDIMEFFKKLGTDIVSHNVHWAYGPHQQTTHGMQSYLKGVSEGFHNFAVEWLPDKYIFYIDGYKFYEVTKGISNIEEYMILSMELPSDKNDIRNAIFPDVFVVDHVKVFKKKPAS
jgi:beta-glucanase (GH16 family)